MVNDTVNINSPIDPITAKFDDNEAMQKLVQQAVNEAVEKARKLGFLKTAVVQEEPAEYLVTKRVP